MTKNTQLLFINQLNCLEMSDNINPSGSLVGRAVTWECEGLGFGS